MLFRSHPRRHRRLRNVRQSSSQHGTYARSSRSLPRIRTPVRQRAGSARDSHRRARGPGTDDRGLAGDEYAADHCQSGSLSGRVGARRFLQCGFVPLLPCAVDAYTVQATKRTIRMILRRSKRLSRRRTRTLLDELRKAKVLERRSTSFRLRRLPTLCVRISLDTPISLTPLILSGLTWALLSRIPTLRAYWSPRRRSCASCRLARSLAYFERLQRSRYVRLDCLEDVRGAWERGLPQCGRFPVRCLPADVCFSQTTSLTERW